MDYQTFHLTSLVGSAAPVAVFPTRDFEERQLAGPTHQRTAGGYLRSYRLAGGPRFEVQLPLAYVTSAQQIEMTTWWRDGRELVLTYNVSLSTVRSLVCRIANDVEPLGGWHRVRRDLRFGVLTLEDVTGREAVAGAPFILDDPARGVTDDPANLLL